MSRVRIVPYRKGSQSAKDLAAKLSELLGYKVWRGPAKPNALNLCWCSK